MLDYRKADKVYRMGMKQLQENEKELKNVRGLYERFTERMKHRVDEEASKNLA